MTFYAPVPFADSRTPKSTVYRLVKFVVQCVRLWPELLLWNWRYGI
jgi:hypothetical protein